jgi:hypothetical protein
MLHTGWHVWNTRMVKRTSTFALYRYVTCSRLNDTFNNSFRRIFAVEEPD